MVKDISRKPLLKNDKTIIKNNFTASEQYKNETELSNIVWNLKLTYNSILRVFTFFL